MSNVIVTPNMNLPNAVPGVDPGPDYANNNFSAFSIIDQHNHTVGNGVQLTPASLNINSALTMNYNDLTNVRTVRFLASTVQPTLPTDLGCIYEFGVDLYYNDQNGNPIQITKGGVVNISSTGQISGITGTASASYSAGTFVFQSATATPANVDGGSFIFRNILPSSKGLTLSPPNAMAANYGLILPSLPPTQSIMTLDASGNITAPYTIDGITLTITAGVIGVKNQGISATQIADATITGTQIASNVALPGNNVTVGGNYPVVANTNPANPLCIVRGTVSYTGAPTAGEGFTSSLAGPNYTVNFTTPFVDTPIIVVTSLGIGVLGIANTVVPSVQTPSGSSFLVQWTGTGAGFVSDVNFNFIAIGQR